MHTEWLEPWYPIERDEERRRLLAELRREASPQHPLWGIAATAVAQRQDNDDVLFALADDRVAVVHLTWIVKPDMAPFPSATLYASIDDFAQTRMAGDHRDWAT